MNSRAVSGCSLTCTILYNTINERQEKIAVTVTSTNESPGSHTGVVGEDWGRHPIPMSTDKAPAASAALGLFGSGDTGRGRAEHRSGREVGCPQVVRSRLSGETVSYNFSLPREIFVVHPSQAQEP